MFTYESNATANPWCDSRIIPWWSDSAATSNYYFQSWILRDFDLGYGLGDGGVNLAPHELSIHGRPCGKLRPPKLRLPRGHRPKIIFNYYCKG